ncbi:hypothetical protein GALMADRAFT_133860 [Galerina marginata CBS 339.88]|uniref:CHAT domain-containing protein n=1 Tax=Galerina marginata (strain CBS 339.88) TaxID=685588 RepID=A0A067TN07_GALM3|nr:hypothetical protein GALMADRAFT_133860 [Galerina marginata CBS 339.88]
MSQVAGLEQTIQKRHSNLVDISNLSTSAAATAIEFGKPGLALEWLEQGRCLVWGQLNNLRTPLLIDTLHGIEPSLSNQMARLSKALEQAGSRTELEALGPSPTVAQKMLIDEENSSHVKLVREWNQLLEKVHELPEFQDFLRPLSYSTLVRGLPKFGTVVIINIQKDRCDAIALNSGIDNPLQIPLDTFSYTKAEDLREQFQAHLRRSDVRMREAERDLTDRGMRRMGDITIKGVLRQLWELVVRPILIGLGFTEPPPELMRIWWCTTGPLAFLPIHAAGIYDGPAPSSLSDFAFSSYIPTVRALIEQVKAPKIDVTQKGLFMISQPNTPGMTPIPATVQEVRAIEKVLEDHKLRVMCLNGENATVSDGLANMETYSCIHLACHASQIVEYPLQSAFFLHDGRLDLGSIIQKRLVGADLAFLSACQTSAGNEKLSEEAVHLAAGMMAAGYRGVVATMWSILDQYGPIVAEEFYKNLISKGGSLDSEHAARALHYATQKLRKELGDSDASLLAWVPYVHFGL